ncbi:MAG: hypothetical protein C4522_22075 [Desulfobacteraceae bacterium]|nr:MAG: hypothetical protein C4522_22075 [Desulfobacteraceae bacterium]
MNEIRQQFEHDFPEIAENESLMKTVSQQIDKDISDGLYDGTDYEDYAIVGRLVRDSVKETLGIRPPRKRQKKKETASDIIEKMARARGQ